MIKALNLLALVQKIGLTMDEVQQCLVYKAIV